MTDRSEPDTPLVLASASPRRRELFARLDLPFDVMPSGIDEDFRGDNVLLWPPVRHPSRIARRLAAEKALALRSVRPNSVILGADTVVAADGITYGKPQPLEAFDARNTLRILRGRMNRVITAVAIFRPLRLRPVIAHAVTQVKMRNYADGEIEASISRGDPFDKAGGYAIQDEVFRPVERYDGCYCNVVGLPLWSTIELLRKSGIDITSHLDRLLPQCATCPLRPDS